MFSSSRSYLMPYTGSCANNRRRIENDTGAATSLVSSHKPVMDKALYGQKGDDKR
jgi:hypothetical protein